MVVGNFCAKIVGLNKFNKSCSFEYSSTDSPVTCVSYLNKFSLKVYERHVIFFRQSSLAVIVGALYLATIPYALVTVSAMATVLSDVIIAFALGVFFNETQLVFCPNAGGFVLSSITKSSR